MDLLNKNLYFLNQVNEGLVNEINSLELNMSDYSIESMVGGGSNIALETNEGIVRMYDEMRVIDDINQVLSNVKKVKNVIFFGLGLAYHIHELVKEDHLKKIIVVEPDLRNLLLFMNFYDLEAFLKNEKIEFIFYNDVDDAIKDLKNNAEFVFNDAVKVETLDYYKLVYKNEYNAFLEEFTKEYSSSVISKNTYIKYDKSFIKNGLLNYINYLKDSFMLEDLYDQYKGVPAVIVGAGPSLNKQLDLLKQFENRALIFAVGSAINILDRHHINHDFKVALDPNEGEAKYFSELENKSVDVIYMPSLNHNALADYIGNKYYCRLEVQPEYEFLERKLGLHNDALKGGGTVSMPTVDIAFRLGCDPIILVGQDFSYSINKYYANGAVNQNYSPQNKIEKTDIYGNTVLTDEGLFALKLGFDQFIKSNFRNRKVEIFNCSEGGLGIEGVENRELVEILNMHCSEERYELMQKFSLKTRQQSCDFDVRDFFVLLKKQLRAVNEILEEVLKNIGQMCEVLKDGENDKKLLNINNNINKFVADIEEYDVFLKWLVPICEARLFLIDDLFNKKYELVTDEKTVENQRILVEFMQMQYTEIKQMCDFVINVLEEGLK